MTTAARTIYEAGHLNLSLHKFNQDEKLCGRGSYWKTSALDVCVFFVLCNFKLVELLELKQNLFHIILLI